MTPKPLPPLSLLQERFNLDPETGKLTYKVRPRGWKHSDLSQHAGSLNPGGYWIVGIEGDSFLAHRIVFALYHGKDPHPYVVDHKDSNPTNNTKDNLQLCTQMENVQKQRVRNTSTTGVRGVYWHKQCSQWIARIKVDYKTIHLGLFRTVEEAAEARRLAEAKYYAITER